MTKTDWICNIENVSAEVEKQYGASTVAYVFGKYGAHNADDLPACFYSEVWSELSFMAEED